MSILDVLRVNQDRILHPWQYHTPIIMLEGTALDLLESIAFGGTEVLNLLAKAAD